MTDSMPSPQHEERPSQNKASKKKLHKRELRMLDRLREAQEAQARALERFHRAEARLQKRMARVQRVEGRLTLIRQQLGAPGTTPSTPEAAPSPSEPRAREEAVTQETHQE